MNLKPKFAPPVEVKLTFAVTARPRSGHEPRSALTKAACDHLGHDLCIGGETTQPLFHGKSKLHGFRARG